MLNPVDRDGCGRDDLLLLRGRWRGNARARQWRTQRRPAWQTPLHEQKNLKAASENGLVLLVTLPPDEFGSQQPARVVATGGMMS